MNRDDYESSLYLAHHGVKGQKWGVRRYQNPDGTLTDAGKKRYQNEDGSLKKDAYKKINVTDYNYSKILGKHKQVLTEDKKYHLSKEQRKYMDEDGNLTLEGARKTMPVGYDLSKKRYKTGASKELDAYSKSWNEYFKNKDTDKGKSLYEEYDKNQKILFNKLEEIDIERGRNMILNLNNDKQMNTGLSKHEKHILLGASLAAAVVSSGIMIGGINQAKKDLNKSHEYWHNSIEDLDKAYRR